MALDEAIAGAVRKKGLPPALRLYGWDRRALSIGCFQKAADIDREYCAAEGIPIVRRPTGGRAVLHHDELTYSFAARTGGGAFSGGLLDSYKRISEAFSLAFRKAGVLAGPRKSREKGSVLSGSPLCFQSGSFAEIMIGERKIVGSAQKRWADGLLQQGSIPYSYDEEETRRVVRIPRAVALNKCMAGVREVIPGLDDAGFKRIIAAAFEETFDISFVLSLPSPEELALARELEEQKYLHPAWNFQR